MTPTIVQMSDEAKALEKEAKSLMARAIAKVFDCYDPKNLPEGFSPESVTVSAMNAALLYAFDAGVSEIIRRDGCAFQNQLLFVVRAFASRTTEVIVNSQGVTKQ